MTQMPHKGRSREGKGGNQSKGIGYERGRSCGAEKARKESRETRNFFAVPGDARK